MSHRSRSRLFAAVLLFLVVGCLEVRPSPELDEGSTLVQLEGPACEGCEIELREVASFTDDDLPVAFSDDSSLRSCRLALRGDGTIVVSGLVGGGQLLFFHPATGEFSLRGTRGAGPGEFGQALRVAVGKGDTLFVVDDQLGRVQIFEPEGGLITTFRAPNAHQSFAVLDSAYMAFFVPPSQRGDPVIHVVDRQGTTVARFQPAVHYSDRLVPDQWELAAHPDGTVWASSTWVFELYRHASDGSLLSGFSREVPGLLPEPPSAESYELGSQPPAGLKFLQHGDDGFLWAFFTVQGENWVPELDFTPLYEWGRATFDTRVEVIDPERGLVLATEVFDDVFGPFCGSPLIYSLSETERFGTRITVWAPTLRMPSPE